MLAGVLSENAARAEDVSPPVILHWFESSYDTIERRTADVFMAGYGAVWTPPPGRADTASVGYDVYDRFDLGSTGKPTLYGTETGIKQLANSVHRAGLDYHVDFVLNHNGYSGTGDAASRQAFGAVAVDVVDFVSPGSVVYGFERFGTRSRPLIGNQAINGPRGDGEFVQDVNARTDAAEFVILSNHFGYNTNVLRSDWRARMDFAGCRKLGAELTGIRGGARINWNPYEIASCVAASAAADRLFPPHAGDQECSGEPCLSNDQQVRLIT